jgi:hypothetical protein
MIKHETNECKNRRIKTEKEQGALEVLGDERTD